MKIIWKGKKDIVVVDLSILGLFLRQKLLLPHSIGVCGGYCTNAIYKKMICINMKVLGLIDLRV